MARNLSAPIPNANSDGQITSQILGTLSLLAFFTTVLTLPIPQMTDFTTILVLLGSILFLLGAIMPLLSGVFLCAVPPSHRVVACSLSSSIQLIVGHAPATLLYGFASRTSERMSDISSNYESRIPITVILYATVFSTMLLLISLVSSLKTSKSPIESGKKSLTAQSSSTTSARLEQIYPLGSPY